MIIEIIVLVLAIEIVSILLRIKFGSMKSILKNKVKTKIHIHHGYIGIILLLVNLFYPVVWVFIIGMALLLSDAIHHFVVLPIWVKRTEFP